MDIPALIGVMTLAAVAGALWGIGHGHNAGFDCGYKAGNHQGHLHGYREGIDDTRRYYEGSKEIVDVKSR